MFTWAGWVFISIAMLLVGTVGVSTIHASSFLSAPGGIRLVLSGDLLLGLLDEVPAGVSRGPRRYGFMLL